MEYSVRLNNVSLQWAVTPNTSNIGLSYTNRQISKSFKYKKGFDGFSGSSPWVGQGQCNTSYLTLKDDNKNNGWNCTTTQTKQQFKHFHHHNRSIQPVSVSLVNLFSTGTAGTTTRLLFKNTIRGASC